MMARVRAANKKTSGAGGRRNAAKPLNNKGRRIMKIVATLAILALIAAPTLASAQDGAMRGAKGGAAADHAYMRSMQKMTKDMDVKPTGNADKDFVMMMTPHHQGAIDMAKVELHYGKDPMLRKLASNIVKAQEKEIGEMKAWLAKNSK